MSRSAAEHRLVGKRLASGQERCAVCLASFTDEHPPVVARGNRLHGALVHGRGCPKKEHSDRLTTEQWQRLAWEALPDELRSNLEKQGTSDHRD